MAGSTGVVMAALIANGAIAIMKFGAFLLTGSPSMLSETYHSISDTGNQVFLLIGIRYGGREADQRHPFGYGKAQFFFAFLVAVMLFGIAGWESAKHGYEKLVHPTTHGGGDPVPILGMELDPVTISYLVLGAAFLFELWALWKARAEMQRQIQRHDWSGYREAFRKTSDVTTLTALTEDFIALSGIVLAFFGILLTQLTENPVFDAAAALLIGIMLMGFALALAWENKRLIMGEALPADEERRLRERLLAHGDVTEVVDIRSMYVGPEEVLFTAEVGFDVDMPNAEIDAAIAEIKADLRETEPQLTRIYIEPED